MWPFSGETGIRTLGTQKCTTVFETVPIDRSGISPRSFLIAVQNYYFFFIPQLFFVKKIARDLF